MNLDFDATENAFREEVRDWLHANVPREPKPLDGPESIAFDREWQRRQFDGGWAGIAWPKEYGGRGLSLIQQLIWHEEYANAHAPEIGSLFIAMNHGGPTLILRGTEEQKKFHLPRILRGESVWCQGFSEPGSGSDLASVRTKGVVDGEHLVVTGQKVWTSYAQHAQYQELLVRTDPDVPKHKGLTWVICDMSLPGITVRPLLSMAGEYHCNEVFYDEVRIPLANVVGKINDGWGVAMCTLSFERGASQIARQIALAQKIEKLVELAKELPSAHGSGPVIRDSDIAYQLATLRAEIAGMRSMTYTAVSRAMREDMPGPEGAMIALYYGDIIQRLNRLATEILGPAALRLGDAESWVWSYLNSFKATISGGTAEIRRNIVAERVLGLPRNK